MCLITVLPLASMGWKKLIVSQCFTIMGSLIIIIMVMIMIIVIRMEIKFKIQ